MELLAAAVRWLVNLCKSAVWEGTFWVLDRLGIDLGAGDYGSGDIGGGGGDIG